MRVLLRFLATGLVMMLAAQSALAQPFTLTTATGYRLEYAVRGQDASGPLALILMHGKNFPAEGVLNRSTQLGEWLARQGFRVYLPVMPWSARWDGTHEDATSAIDALVELAAKDGKKVIVGGHSLGAMFTILYRASAPPPAVIGKLVSAPGHMLDLIAPQWSFWADIRPSLEQAQALEAAGKGQEKVRFGGRNTTGRQMVTESYEMTPRVYLSWHDPQRLPSSTRALKDAAVPVFWSVGNQDPLSRNNASEETFRMMPAHPKSRFVLLDGKDHSTSYRAAMDSFIPWAKALVAP